MYGLHRSNMCKNTTTSGTKKFHLFLLCLIASVALADTDTAQDENKIEKEMGQSTHFQMEDQSSEIEVHATDKGVDVKTKPASLKVLAKPNNQDTKNEKNEEIEKLMKQPGLIKKMPHIAVVSPYRQHYIEPIPYFGELKKRSLYANPYEDLSMLGPKRKNDGSIHLHFGINLNNNDKIERRPKRKNRWLFVRRRKHRTRRVHPFRRVSHMPMPYQEYSNQVPTWKVPYKLSNGPIVFNRVIYHSGPHHPHSYHYLLDEGNHAMLHLTYHPKNRMNHVTSKQPIVVTKSYKDKNNFSDDYDDYYYKRDNGDRDGDDDNNDDDDNDDDDDDDDNDNDDDNDDDERGEKKHKITSKSKINDRVVHK